MDELKIGSMVVLRSAPDVEMAVTQIAASESDHPEGIQCAWFDGKRHLQVGIFPREALRLTTSREGQEAVDAAKAEVVHLRLTYQQALDEIERHKVAVSFLKQDQQDAMRVIRPFIGSIPTSKAGDAALAVTDNFQRYKDSATAVVDQIKEELKQARAKLIELGYVGPLV